MSNSDKNETESPAIIEEIIPGKNNDYNDKSINQNDNNNNNQKPFIQKYNEHESAQAVSEATEDDIKNMKRGMSEAENQVPSHSQVKVDTQEQMGLATRETIEMYWELQKQATDSFQTVFAPYFQSLQNQFWNNQGFFNSISELYSKLVSNYVEGAIAYSRIFNEVASANMNFLRNAVNSSPVNQERRTSSLEVDSGKNSDESSTNVRATFSCETCGQIFDSRQALKEHTSLTHYQ